MQDILLSPSFHFLLHQNDCQNYIRVLEVLDNGTKLLVCGTNAFNPKCRNYRKRYPWSQEWIFSKEFSGKGFCPYDPRHNSTAIFAGNRSCVLEIILTCLLHLTLCPFQEAISTLELWPISRGRTPLSSENEYAQNNMTRNT